MCTRRSFSAFLFVVALAVAEVAISAFAQDVGKYSGPGSCAASNCHGSVTPRTTTEIRQNEYSIWAAQDRHAHAYLVLSNPVSLRMGKILKLSTPPAQADKCRVDLARAQTRGHVAERGVMQLQLDVGVGVLERTNDLAHQPTDGCRGVADV